MWVEFSILIGLVAVLLYKWVTKNNDFFVKRGLPHEKPFPVLGSMKDVILRKKNMPEMINDMYRKHDGKVYGVFDQRVPVFMIRDPELIKQITVKDFDHFVNHRPQFRDQGDANLFGRSVFAMVDSTWKDMRSTLSPAFTGSKMRQMYQLINQVAQDTVVSMKDLSNMNDGIEIELKDYATRFTNDVIASTAFGLQVNSLKERDNEFYKVGKRVTNFTAWQNLKFFLMSNFKVIMKLLKIELFDKADTDYFMRLVLDAMKYRKENNISRPDMINMLMEARGMIKTDSPKQHNRDWNDVDIVAQCFIFFFAGFETSSTLLCFAAHELMENEDIQQKLYEEIQQVDQDLEGKAVTYEALQKMTYLDMVISETLRKWPAAVALDRECNEDIVYEKDGERIEIKKGDSIWIPVWGIHHDEKYYENPEKFDPERFNEENKDKIDTFHYMPFGVGPRNCIGSRFALLEAKAFIYYLVRDFRLLPGKKSSIPLKLSKSSFQLMPEGGFWLKFVPRAKV